MCLTHPSKETSSRIFPPAHPAPPECNLPPCSSQFPQGNDCSNNIHFIHRHTNTHTHVLRIHILRHSKVKMRGFKSMCLWPEMLVKQTDIVHLFLNFEPTFKILESS